MISRIPKAIFLGFLTALVGLGATIAPFGPALEEDIGLNVLFGLRGARHAPSDVIIVSADKESASRLDLPDDPRKWPRQLHARLVERLTREGAGAIAFDIFFADPRSPDEDLKLSEAMREAQNVVVSGYLKRESFPLDDRGGTAATDLTIERLIPPVAPLAQSALGVAPFPLPKVPVRVSQYWTFKAGAGDVPTLPVVVLQTFTLGLYGHFRHLMEEAAPSSTIRLPSDRDAAVRSGGIEKLVRDLREIFQNHPLLAEQMLREVASAEDLSEQVRQRVRSLIGVYSGVNNRYLNFYGPPRTITTVPYYRFLLDGEGHTSGAQSTDVKGKAVFVGHSELYRSEQKDGFYTVFSQSNGLDLSGVEIAATAFANLLQDLHVEPLGFNVHVAIIVLWGILIGFICRFFPASSTAVSLIVLCGAYLLVAEYRFKSNGVWYPVVIPLFLQTPFAFFSAVLMKYRESNKERESIRKAFGYYLPDGVVDRLSKNIAEIKTGNQLVYGICLSTDAEHYTSLSETMDPQELSRFMNKYYESIFEPIRRRAGVVANVVGDSMLAVWVAAAPDSALKEHACLAALDIAEVVRRFGQSTGGIRLATRIGLHSGYIVLGNIGAGDHYEYRPVGDIVNTATRIEGLNKYLGTRVLVSEDVMSRLDGFVTRGLGKFLLVGKSKPIVVHELLCRTEDADEQRINTCSAFAAGLDAFRSRSWDEATERFGLCIKDREGDGPSQFYLRLCQEYKMHPPGDSWDGEVYMDKK